MLINFVLIERIKVATDVLMRGKKIPPVSALIIFSLFREIKIELILMP